VCPEVQIAKSHSGLCESRIGVINVSTHQCEFSFEPLRAWIVHRGPDHLFPADVERLDERHAPSWTLPQHAVHGGGGGLYVIVCRLPGGDRTTARLIFSSNLSVHGR